MAIRPPQSPDGIIEPLLEDLKRVLGSDLLAACLFGSAARGDYERGRSDINLLLLVGDQSRHTVSRLVPFYRKWSAARLAPPLVMTPHYLETSRDVFPIEFLTMAASHRCIYGQDPLAAIELRPQDLRLQLERELKGKLTLLRSRLLASQGQGKALMALIHESAPAFTALFQALLHLSQGSFPPKPALVMEQVGRAGFKADAFERMQRVRAGQLELEDSQLAALLEEAISQLSEICDQVDAIEAPAG